MSSDHGSDGPWKTTYANAPVRLDTPRCLLTLGLLIFLANS